MAQQGQSQVRETAGYTCANCGQCAECIQQDNPINPLAG
jgi:hypothetical protein